MGVGGGGPGPSSIEVICFKVGPGASTGASSVASSSHESGAPPARPFRFVLEPRGEFVFFKFIDNFESLASTDIVTSVFGLGCGLSIIKDWISPMRVDYSQQIENRYRVEVGLVHDYGIFP